MMNILTFCIFVLLSSNLLADRTNIISDKDPSNPCQTDFDPDSTMITLSGDSLGDFVDSPLYGYFGWRKREDHGILRL